MRKDDPGPSDVHVPNAGGKRRSPPKDVDQEPDNTDTYGKTSAVARGTHRGHHTPDISISVETDEADTRVPGKGEKRPIIRKPKGRASRKSLLGKMNVNHGADGRFAGGGGGGFKGAGGSAGGKGAGGAAGMKRPRMKIDGDVAAAYRSPGSIMRSMVNRAQQGVGRGTHSKLVIAAKDMKRGDVLTRVGSHPQPAVVLRAPGASSSGMATIHHAGANNSRRIHVSQWHPQIGVPVIRRNSRR